MPLKKNIYLWILLGFGVCAVAFKIAWIGLEISGDYGTYISMAHWFRGDAGAQVFLYRILKPLNPLLVAGLSQTGLSVERSFLFQVIAFYFGLIVLSFYWLKSCFQDQRKAFVGTLLIALSYPMLRYGVENYTETGAWFFYLASLALTWAYLQKPSWRNAILHALVASMGFLWKEYAVVGVGIWHLVVLFQPQVSWKTKIQHLVVFDLIFGGMNGAWQWWVMSHYDFSYLTWREIGAYCFSTQFFLKNIVKSLFALLMFGWVFALVGLRSWKALSSEQQRYLLCAIPVPFIVFAWGCVSSRLYFVIAPAAILLAVHGIFRIFPRGWRLYVATSIVLASHIGWLVLSYRN